MKRRFTILMVAALALVACTQTKKTPVDTALERYAVVTIGKPDLEGISDNGKEVLNLYKFAAIEADKIYWKQVFGDADVINRIQDEATRDYAKVNYGPWDRRNGKSFISGYKEMPAGANFYPADMTDEEFQAFGDSLKNSPYTLIHRKDDGSLGVEWYHDAYANHIETIVTCLKTAAEITIKPSVANYLNKKVEALQTDDYYESELAWLDMTDSKMDLILGPDEATDDRLYGLKKSYEAYVLLKDEPKTEELSKLAGTLDELQANLPCKDEYKNSFKPGKDSEIYAYDALYLAGAANAGEKFIAVNLPFDEKVQAEKGTRTVIMENIINSKFYKVLAPASNVLLNKEDEIDEQSFFWLIAFREIAHGLGVRETVNGNGLVSTALGKNAQVIEEAKGSILGAYYADMLANKHELSTFTTYKTAIATYLVNLVRSCRFGNVTPVGMSTTICYNYLKSKGAFQRGQDGKYAINYEEMQKAVAALAEEILNIQATGDKAAAEKLIADYGQQGDDLKEDFTNLHMEQVPIDIRLEYNW